MVPSPLVLEDLTPVVSSLMFLEDPNPVVPIRWSRRTRLWWSLSSLSRPRRPSLSRPLFRSVLSKSSTPGGPESGGPKSSGPGRHDSDVPKSAGPGGPDTGGPKSAWSWRSRFQWSLSSLSRPQRPSLSRPLFQSVLSWLKRLPSTCMLPLLCVSGPHTPPYWLPRLQSLMKKCSVSHGNGASSLHPNHVPDFF